MTVQKRPGYRLRIRGEVQGVGFRPHVYQVANELALAGSVINDGQGVMVELACSATELDRFVSRLQGTLPALARIDAIDTLAVDVAAKGFSIKASRQGAVTTQIAPDAATCQACLDELLDPDNRRYRYPFINCTHCGPRFSIIRRLPYDRPFTTMAEFELCDSCHSEYRDPTDRRFHAQPTACADCGPTLSLLDDQGDELASADAIQETLARLERGDIVAIKGIGGFHLACDARNSDAVARLRARKHRPHKPLALMAANLASLAKHVELNETCRELLTDASAPIVLAPMGNGVDLPESLAPGIDSLGVMLPYTPLHHLLFFEAAGRPAGPTWRSEPQSLLLVMTSGNASGRPLVHDNDEAINQLGGIADAFLLHDRPIHQRCDDGIVNAVATPPITVRRGRGMAPRKLTLPGEGPATLALGGYLKNTFCLTRGDQAFVSHYIGDLDNPDNCRFLADSVEHLRQLLDIEVAQIACDNHPDFYSSRLAVELAERWQVPLHQVQHHHAHAAAVAAEAGLTGNYLALALDGVGLGDDGSAWGGELLTVTGNDACRLGHLAPLILPGGDRAAREPWRVALAIELANGKNMAESRYQAFEGASVVDQMIARGLNCPETTSAGRLFDAAASLLGICDINSYEAEAAMKLEAAAGQGRQLEPDIATQYYRLQDGQLDFGPLLAALPGWQAGDGAARFHQVVAQGLARWCRWEAGQSGCQDLVLGGGCFLNQRLTEALRSALAGSELRIHAASVLPPNDSGLSLGQAWTAILRSKKQKQQEGKLCV